MLVGPACGMRKHKKALIVPRWGWGNIGFAGNDVFLKSVCAWVRKGIQTQNLKNLEPQRQ